MPDVEQELARLYGLPLDEFTKARNDLASALAKAGQKEAAAEVKALAKPSVPVWAANQLARREPGEVRALLRSGEQLMKAQERALAGRTSEDLRARVAEQRKAVRALARLGRDLLAEEGRAASDATVDRIAKTLDAAALDEAARPLLKSGRLTEELEPPGFGLLAGMKVARQKGATRGPDRDRLAQARARARSARTEARELRREAERAERAAGEAAQQADEARAAAEEAERALAQAESELEQLS